MRREPAAPIDYFALPERLFESATLVVWACAELTEGQRILWYHTWRMDKGLERAARDRCYMGAASMGRRIAIASGTVADYWSLMARMGLILPFARPEGRNFGRIAILPPACMPRSQEMADVAGEEAERLAGLLAVHLRTLKETWARQSPGPRSVQGGSQTPTGMGDTLRRRSG